MDEEFGGEVWKVVDCNNDEAVDEGVGLSAAISFLRSLRDELSMSVVTTFLFRSFNTAKIWPRDGTPSSLMGILLRSTEAN